MRKTRLPRLMLLLGITGLSGITAWNFFQTDHAMMQSHQRWAQRVSEMITAERVSFDHWLEQFPAEDPSLITTVSESNPYVVALFLADAKNHRTRHWVNPSSQNPLKALDPRLGVLQIKALQTQQTQMGPVLRIDGVPHCTAVRPLGAQRTLTAVVRAEGLWSLLEEESRLWHLRVFVYDYDRQLIFSSGDLATVQPAIDAIVAKVRAGATKGHLPLTRHHAWQWVATFHYDPVSDWIFIVAEPVVWPYAPVLFFLISLFGVLVWVRLPIRASQALQLKRWSQELSQFALRVDNFVRGRDVALKDPPYPFNELTPIVRSLRWLMPQWKKAEAFPKELALERKLLALLVESLPEGILFFSAQGNLQLSNELGRVFMALQQEAGREMKMVSGIQIPRGFLEPYLEPVFTSAQKNMGKEVEVRWADGKHLYRIWVESIEEDEGQTAGFIVVIRDITFRKQWEYVQEQVLSGITHDLRGPLSAVMGYLDLIRRQLGESGPPKVSEYVKLAREAGVRLTQMVSDILDVVRFEQGKIELQPQALPVAGIFDRLQNIFSVSAEQKKVALKFHLQGDHAMSAWGDPKLLERVLDNLVGNAIKFTPAGGLITVSALGDHNRTTFEVADSGRGIPREAQSRIFDKFQQVRPGDRSSGYGLGLAVAKFIVEAHRGEIRVESEVGVGSRFTFWIPAQSSSAAVSATESAEPLTATDGPAA